METRQPSRVIYFTVVNASLPSCLLSWVLESLVPGFLPQNKGCAGHGTASTPSCSSKDDRNVRIAPHGDWGAAHSLGSVLLWLWQVALALCCSGCGRECSAVNISPFQNHHGNGRGGGQGIREERGEVTSLSAREVL